VSDLEREVAAVVARIVKVPAERIAPETDLRLAFNVDSLQGLQIVASLEKRFGVTVPDGDFDQYSSTAAIVGVLEPLLREQQRGGGAVSVPPPMP
jgi:acyl carrier protein